MKNLKYRYREVRIAKNMTLQEAAAQIGKSKQWLSDVELGHVKLKYSDSIELASVYGGTPDIFLPNEYDKTGQNNDADPKA